MNCPKCNSNNTNVQIQTFNTNSRTKHKGGTHAIMRACLILMTCGLWLLVPKAKETTKYKNKTVKTAVCNDCGNSWKI